MDWKRLRWGSLAVAVLLAAVLAYLTFAVSAGISCGAYNYGPNPGAEADFCGYTQGEETDFSAWFILVQLVPAVPVLAGGVLAFVGWSRLYVVGGLIAGMITALVIFQLEP